MNMFNVKTSMVMKSKTILAMAVLLLSLCGLVSCVSETETEGSGEEAVVTRSIVFNISLPTGDPIHVKTRTAIQEEGEYAIKSLYLLVFDAATDVLKAKTSVTLTGEGATAQASGNDYKYTYQWTPEMGDACRFVFVANEDVASITGLTVDTSTWTDLQAAVSSASRTFASGSDLSTVFATATNGLPMSGVAYYRTGDAKNEIIPIRGTSDAAIPVQVDLTRIVARVDVYNKTPNLYITSIRMVHANPQSYLMPHKDGSGVTVIPTGLTKVGGAVEGLLPFNSQVEYESTTAAMSASHPMVGSADDDGTELKKAFYVYEDDVYENATPATLEGEALALQVTGKLGSLADGVDVFYQIPFINKYKSGGADDNTSVEIKRNHIYKVIIGDGTSVSVNSRIRATLTVADWTGTAVASTFEDALFNSEPVGAVGTYNRDTRLITLASNAAVTSDDSANDLTIKVSDTYSSSVTITGIEVLTEGSTWKAYNDAGGTGWLSADLTDTKTVTLTATANASGSDRIGSVRITYSYVDGSSVTQTGAKIVFSVYQPA